MREVIMRLIPKEDFAYLKEDKKFVEFITNEVKKALSESLIQVLEANGEIIIKKPVLVVSEYQSTNHVAYGKSVDWEPLVRCKDCIYYEHEAESEEWGLCRSTGAGMSTMGFCSDADRRVKEDEK